MAFPKFFSLLLLTLTLFHHTVSGQELMHICSMSANYSTNDPYETSLVALLSYLNNEAPSNGFAVGSKGEGLSQTHGLALCRGDLSPTDCGNCVVRASNNMIKECPYNKGAMILQETCTVRYSNQDFFGQTMNNIMLCLTSPKNVSDPTPEFGQKTQEFLSQISQEAVMHPTLYKAGKLEIDMYSTVYGYAQCSRDLSLMDCNKCLIDSIAYLKECGEEKEGVSVYSGNCRVRYEIYPFLNDEHSTTTPPRTSSPNPDAITPYPPPTSSPGPDAIYPYPAPTSFPIPDAISPHLAPTSFPSPDAFSPYPAPESSAHALEPGVIIFIGLLSLIMLYSKYEHKQ